ncbi:MAG: Csp1 family four helix bundle copper storage protein [Elusimicrobiota bacterium]
MNRREFLGAAALALPAFALSEASAATTDEAAPAAAGSGKLDAAVAAAEHCLQTGRECERHCWEMVGKGRVEMKDCGDSTRNMLAACEALVKVGVYRSASDENLKRLAAACAGFCRACEEQCRKHAAQHKICADCMQSCIDCAKACEALA